MKKSKFVTFFLSFLPGLSHLYLGISERAIVFFCIFFGTIAGTVFLNDLARSNRFSAIPFFVLPLTWLVALVDAMAIANRINSTAVPTEGGFPAVERGAWFDDNRKLFTVAFSLIPGAGHMYLGFLTQGTQLMALFFGTLFLMGWMNMSIFLFALPVIWFYSLFDALHKSEGAEVAFIEENPLAALVSARPKVVGWGLIILGGFAIFDRIVAPYINYQFRNYLQTGIVALLLIGAGVRLIVGSKHREEVKACNEEE